MIKPLTKFFNTGGIFTSRILAGILGPAIIAILLGATGLYSQAEIKFLRYTKDDGLSTSGPAAVFKDSRGFIWIASQNGLNRFDGTRFKWFTHDVKDSNSISDDWVMCLCEDSDGNIWAGTLSNGLNKYDRKTGKFEVYRNEPGNENSLSSNDIRAIVYDNGRLWIGTQHGGLNLLDIKTGKFRRFRHSPNNPFSISDDFIWTLIKDRYGNIWIGTNSGGLSKYDVSRNTFRHYKNIPGDNESISGNEVRALFEDKDGNIWAGTNGKGLNRLNIMSDKFSRIGNEKFKNSSDNPIIMGITQDDDGKIWFGGYYADISMIDPANLVISRIVQANTQIPKLDGLYALSKDITGTIWICHEGYGLYYYDRDKPRFNHYYNNPNDRNSLLDNIVWSFCEDDENNVWIAHRKGLSIFNPASKNFRNIEYVPGLKNGISNNAIRSVYRDHKDIIWLGNGTTVLDYYDMNKKTFGHFYSHPGDTMQKLSNVTCITEDRNGQLWMGTYSDGLKMFDKGRTSVTTYKHNEADANSISSNSIWNINFDNDDNLWIGTWTTGMDKLDIKTGKFTNYHNNLKDSNSLAVNIVTFIHQDKSGIYWIATYGGGLSRYDIKENVFRHYTVNDGLPDNGLYGFLEDKKGYFWISTNRGLSRFDPHTETFVNFNTGDGIQSQEFNQNCFFRSGTGEFYFGGINGFNVFNPDEIAECRTFPPLALTSFRVFNKEAELPVSITETKEVELSYRDNFFTIEYSALEYTNPAKIEYAYILEGVDKKWNYVLNGKSANYTNVEPGNYTFRVKSTNRDRIWNESSLSLSITIIPPWWQRLWFRFLAAAVFIGFVGYGMNRKYSSIKKEKKIQEDFMRKLIDSQEHERKRISSELHDSLGQELVIIKNNANLALQNRDNAEAVKFIKNISEISSSALQNVRAISHNLRPVELDKLGLTETVKSIVEMTSSSSEINFSTEIGNIDSTLDSKNDVNFCRIIQECLSNIMKHSKAKNAAIRIESDGTKIFARIKDDGTGFDYEAVMNDIAVNSFGLTGISERVKMLDGTLRIISSRGEGTEIIINIPLKRKD